MDILHVRIMFTASYPNTPTQLISVSCYNKKRDYKRQCIYCLCSVLLERKLSHQTLLALIAMVADPMVNILKVLGSRLRALLWLTFSLTPAKTNLNELKASASERYNSSSPPGRQTLVREERCRRHDQALGEDQACSLVGVVGTCPKRWE